MAKSDPHWQEKVASTMQKGALHRMLGIAPGEKIPFAKLVKAAHSHDKLERKRAQLAQNMGAG